QTRRKKETEWFLANVIPRRTPKISVHGRKHCALPLRLRGGRRAEPGEHPEIPFRVRGVGRNWRDDEQSEVGSNRARKHGEVSRRLFASGESDALRTDRGGEFKSVEAGALSQFEAVRVGGKDD